MPIAAANLRAQHAALQPALGEALRRVLDSGVFIGGPEVEGFEREFAAYCGVRHALGVGNGTDALALALRALDVGRGSAVALPAFTFAGTAEAVCHVGAQPLFVDIDSATFTLDPAALRRAVEASSLPVRAVIPVHLYGQPADMDAIVRVARDVGAAVVEDAAQAHGVRYGSRRAGGLGTIAAFSFYPTKNLGALGDAGAVTTDDAEVAARVALLRDHGQAHKYDHAVVGYNSRLDALQAAALRVKLAQLEVWNARRRAIASRYDAALSGLAAITSPAARHAAEHVYHLYVIRCAARDALQNHLAAAGIAAGVHYPVPLHLTGAFAALGYHRGDFPASEAAAREVLGLPVYPELTDAEVGHVCAVMRDWAAAHAQPQPCSVS